jgi:putative transcriptional regulator
MTVANKARLAAHSPLPAAVAANDPSEITAIRRRAGASQQLLADYFNVERSTLAAWERGEKKPNGPARKLLDLVRLKGLHALA